MYAEHIYHSWLHPTETVDMKQMEMKIRHSTEWCSEVLDSLRESVFLILMDILSMTRILVRLNPVKHV